MNTTTCEDHCIKNRQAGSVNASSFQGVIRESGPQSALTVQRTKPRAWGITDQIHLDLANLQFYLRQRVVDALVLQTAHRFNKTYLVLWWAQRQKQEGWVALLWEAFTDEMYKPLKGTFSSSFQQWYKESKWATIVVKEEHWLFIKIYMDSNSWYFLRWKYVGCIIRVSKSWKLIW